MDFERLQQALAIAGDTVTISRSSILDIAHIQDSCYGGQDIVLSEARPGDGDGRDLTVVRTGKSSFLGRGNLPVVATFKLVTGGSPNPTDTVIVTLRYILPAGWKFSHSFPNLPKVTDWRKTVADPMSVPLDDLEFDSAAFVVASQPQPGEEPQLEAGINFVGKLRVPNQDPAGVTGAVRSAFGYEKDQLTIAGTIRLPRDGEITTPLKPSERPWERQPVPPGILLRANLNCEVPLGGSSGSQLKFGGVCLRIYSPTSSGWLAANSTCAPVLAYTGTLNLPGAGVTCSIAALQELGGNELLLAGRFTGASIEKLASLADIGGSNDLLAPMCVLHNAVEKLPKLELMSASIAISMKKAGFEVTSASVMIGMPNLHWPVFSDQFVIRSVSALIDIDSPFGAPATDPFSRFRRKHRVNVTLFGTLEIFQTLFDFTATTRDPFTLNARLAAGETIPLSSLFRKYPNCVPSLGPNVAIDYLAFTAQHSNADSTYSFACRVKSEPKLEIIRGVALSEVVVSLRVTSPRGGGTRVDGSVGAVLNVAGVDVSLKTRKSGSHWLFEGSTGPGQKIPVGALVAQFLDVNSKVPPAIESLIFQDLAVSYSTGNKDLRLSGKAELKLQDRQYRASATVDLTGDAWSVSGSLSVGGAEFKFEVLGGDSGQQLVANWDGKSQPPPSLLAIDGNSDLGLTDLSSLLTPKNATLTLNFKDGEKSLALACEQVSGTKAAFLLAQVSGAWVAAVGVKPARVSTKNLELIGSWMKPYELALDKMVVLSASRNAPGMNLQLGDRSYSVSKGLSLQGALELAESSSPDAPLFSAPFECRLGGEAISEPSRQTAPTDQAKRVEAGNNVAVGRTTGALTFRNARLEFRDKRVCLLLDASLGSGGLAMDLEGFNCNFPLTFLLDPKNNVRQLELGLDGLSIAYSKPPLSIAGGFARKPVEEPYVDRLYEGFLLVESAKFQISVLGWYGKILDKTNEKKDSLFIYGAHAGVVGGPAEFYVTALALGGGYNTQLALPPVEKVAEFPLVQAVREPAKFTLATLRSAVQASPGDHWLAVGVKFTSYRIVDSFALFSVLFGNRLQFALLGMTKLVLPSGAREDACAILAEMSIRAVLDPEDGVFSIEGQLTPRSFILTNKLRLTGGFAFFVWFGKSRHAGDFVVSLGGYHRDFPRPAHYPVVPRVGFNGVIGALKITGEAYLAVTPSCLMAGQKLDAVFESDNVRAAFVAYADFIMAWAPFHYDAEVGIDISVVVRLLITYRLEASAVLHIWGPPFAGAARVSLSIISFTIAFGGPATKPNPLKWEEFAKAFLPATTANKTEFRLATIRITEGLVGEFTKDSTTYRIVNPHELAIETESVVPCSQVGLGKTTLETTKVKIGIRPMGARTLDSRHLVTIVDKAGVPVDPVFIAVCSPKNYPEALWSEKAGSGKADANMLKGALSGMVLRVRPNQPAHRLGPFPITEFAYSETPKNIPWTAAKSPPGDRARERFSGISESNALRDQIRDCLNRHLTVPGNAHWNRINMQKTRDDLGGRFQAPPISAALGQRLTGSER